jgi:hypothetical protein
VSSTEGAAEGKAPALRVLVVDDNRDAADSLCLPLRTWGFDVRVGPHAAIGLAVAHWVKPVQYDGLMPWLAEFTDAASR